MTGDDIFITAASGGVNYWCVPTRINDHVISIEPIDEFEDDFEAAMLTDEALVVAAHQVAGGDYANSEITGWVKQAIDNDDPGMIDAACADVIVQVALFGGVVYG